VSSERKSILFVVNSRNYNVFNRNSAIDSILCSILIELSSFYDVYVNGKPMPKKIVYNQSALKKLSEGSGIRKLVPGFIKQIARDLRVFRDNKILLNEISRMKRPDVIIELMRYGSDLGTELKKKFRSPLIAYFDAPSVEENKYLRASFSPFYPRVSRIEENTISEADKVVVYSEAIRDYWLKRIKDLDAAKFAIFQTLDYSRLVFNDAKQFNEPLTIGFVGSFLKWHRVENLVHAFNKLRNDGVNAKLLLVGAGEEFESVKAKAEQSGWKNDITLTGFIDGEKLKECRNSIDIGVMPGTHWYCMPTKVFEYGAAGIASIAPGTKSIRCMFNEDEVVFLNDTSADELYKKLSDLISGPQRMKELATNLRVKISSRNSLPKASAFYRNMIEELTSN
jgi:glycosyltransferase involved in cell wall biosynthesis